MSDATAMFRLLFGRGEFLSCSESADANDDSKLSLTDAIAILSQLFGQREGLPAPFEACGIDPKSDDTLGCDRFDPCEP